MGTRAIVAGTGFYSASTIRSACKPGSIVALVREPKNKVDPNAIAVYLVVRGLLFTKRVQIGHLKASLAKRLAPKLDAGATAKAMVVSLWAPGDREFPRVSIDIELV